MNGKVIWALVLTLLGVVITLATVRDGLSFGLLLGLLLIADGVIRFLMLSTPEELDQSSAHSPASTVQRPQSSV
jgi:hypothetical protein